MSEAFTQLWSCAWSPFKFPNHQTHSLRNHKRNTSKHVGISEWWCGITESYGNKYESDSKTLEKFFISGFKHPWWSNGNQSFPQHEAWPSEKRLKWFAAVLYKSAKRPSLIVYPAYVMYFTKVILKILLGQRSEYD